MSGETENKKTVLADIWKQALEDILDPTSKMSEAEEKEYHNKILRKLRQGRRLTTEEKNYLQIHDPEMYKVALRVEMSRKRFVEQAKHCKSKEEFQTLVGNNMKTVEQDPMKEYIQAAISYEAQNIRKSPSYAALPDTNREAEEKRKKGKKIKKLRVDEDKDEEKYERYLYYRGILSLINKENSYNSYLDYLNETYTPRYPYFSSELGYNGQNSYTYQYTK